jgi:hypothetical protein
MVTWFEILDQPSGSVLDTLQRCNCRVGQTSKDGVAVVQSAQDESRHETGSYINTKYPSDLTESTQVVETRAGHLVDVRLHRQFIVKYDTEIPHTADWFNVCAIHVQSQIGVLHLDDAGLRSKPDDFRLGRVELKPP